MTVMLTSPAGTAAQGVVDQLRPLLGERLVTSNAVREQHRAEGQVTPALPDAVAFPVSTEEVAAIVRLCAAAKVPVIPFGAGTSLEGQLEAVRGGISLDLTRMDRIIQVNADDLDCRIEAGVTREQLNQHLRAQGLFFPLDPGANATLGGMAATRASGTNAVRYGTMREVTLGLTVVTPQGEVIRTGGRARKSSAGYDLTRVYIGSEGTLGVITELQLRLFGIPEVIASAVCQFDGPEGLEGLVGAVTMAVQMGIPLARIEMLDEVQMGACIAYSKLEGMRAAPTLFLEFHGGPQGVAEQIEQMRGIVAEFGGGSFRFAEAAEDRNRLWKARHDAYWAARALKPGTNSITTDACVPISALASVVAETKAEAVASGLICPIVGHVGDGNFHVMILHDPNDAAERARAKELGAGVARRAIAAGGTCTGEHGVGLGKLDYMREEHGPALGVMRALKAALDPDGIMNPGKTVPAA